MANGLNNICFLPIQNIKEAAYELGTVDGLLPNK